MEELRKRYKTHKEADEYLNFTLLDGRRLLWKLLMFTKAKAKGRTINNQVILFKIREFMIDNDTIMYRRLLEKIGGLRDLCYTYKEEEMRALKLRRPAWLREHGLKAGTIENATPMRCNSFMEVHFTLSINESSLDILIRYPHDKRKKPEILKTVGNLPIPLTKEFLKVINVLKKHGLEASELFKYLY